nr:MAG TPA: hypothetical protein [Caudoviricetes sp.]
MQFDLRLNYIYIIRIPQGNVLVLVEQEHCTRYETVT